MKVTAKRQIAYIVPAHNEERVIGTTLEALMKIADAQDIYVGSDGSKDRTVEIAHEYTKNVLDQQPNIGKASVLNKLIKQYQLTKRYKYVMPVDADTNITKHFVAETLRTMEEDEKQEIVCAVGKVVGKNASWVTTYRIWEYEIGQLIYKRAQSIMNTVLVCPGCATLYRAQLFETVRFPTGTVTEDMDLTFQIHRSKLGRIVFVPEALVITQDPKTLRDYVKQIHRWYKGFWQAVVKHGMPWGGQRIDAEVMLLATEGLFNGILMVALLVLAPLMVISGSNVIMVAMLADLSLFLIPTMIYVSWRHRLPKMMLYVPHFYFMRVFVSLLFLRSFLAVIYSARSREGWKSPTRYKLAT